MAITNNGIKVSLGSQYLPTGYTAPSYTAVTGDVFTSTQDISILKSAVENASAVTGFTNLVNAVDTAAAALVTLYYNAAEAITFYTDFIALDDNTCVGQDESAYTTDAEAFTCTVRIFVQTVEIT